MGHDAYSETIEVSEGLLPGTRVAVAGANSLEPGQLVKIPRT